MRSSAQNRSSNNAPVGRAGLIQCRYAEHLTVRARTFSSLVGLALLVLLAGSPSWAQDPSGSPSPQDPSSAYPLNPGETTAPASPQLDDEASATPAASRGDDGGVPPAVPIGLAALLAVGAGLGLVALRRRERPAEPVAVAVGAVTESPPPKRFQWRDYPEPARPAPPPPPVPGAKSPKFEVGLEEERSSSPPRAKQREAR
jgi:hypothetical protein